MLSPFIGRLRKTLALMGLAFASMSGHVASKESATAKLERFHDGLAERYPDVAHISPDDLQKVLSDDVVLFDVRKNAEYDVSRIAGAIRVSPSISASDFLREHASALEGKTVVFYCSVGERSSRLAERVLSQAGGARAEAVYNLEGGLFKWHNEYRDVVAENGETTAVHPFDRRWGRLLVRQDAIRTKPDAG